MLKRKLLVPMVALLLCVGMIGVGFAAWMISNEDVHENNQGDFIVHQVENNAITLDIEIIDSAINFAPTTKTAQGDWLSFDGEDTEDLSATLKFTVNEWATLKTKTIELEIKDFKIVGATGFAGMDVNGVSNGQYIVLPANQDIVIAPSGNTWTVKIGDEVVTGATVDGENGIFTIPLNFGWGSKVVSQNPINYYNDLDNTAVNRAAAESFLAEIYKLNGAKYQFTVSAKIS